MLLEGDGVLYYLGDRDAALAQINAFLADDDASSPQARAVLTTPRSNTRTPEAAQSGPAARMSSALSPREREVAELVAAGLTNREIAERLVITEGTATLDVKHVLAKLGFRSCAQIAAWVVGKNLSSSASSV